MEAAEKLSVTVTPSMARMIREKVEQGSYGSASEVIREALREWRLRQPLRQAELDRLRKAWAQGLESGRPEPFDIDDIVRRARNRFESGSDTPRNG